MKKWFVMLAVLLLPCMALADTFVTLSGPYPLMCGSGLVALSGTAKVEPGSTANDLEVYFKQCTTASCTIGTSNIVHEDVVPSDGVVHEWKTYVNVIQGKSYKILVALRNPNGSIATSYVQFQPVPVCNEDDLLQLCPADVQDRLDTIP